MPVNPHKRRCQTPNCRSWAMRGQNHCRSHRDHELGPRGAGAPKGNLNALKSGRYAKPARTPDLLQMAHDLAQRPDQFLQLLYPLLQSFDDRADNPYSSLVLIIRFLEQLRPFLADSLFSVQLEDYLRKVRPSDRPRLEAQIWNIALPCSPQERLYLYKELVRRFPPELITRKTIDGSKNGDT